MAQSLDFMVKLSQTAFVALTFSAFVNLINPIFLLLSLQVGLTVVKENVNNPDDKK
jgi:hypothetical protein